MEYSALELKGSGSLNKSQFLSTSDYTFFLYRVPNQTGASPNLSGSGYFTFETKRNALGNYSGSTSYINGASLNPSVANSSNTASFGVKTLVSSSFIFSYDLFETTNSLYSATSSFQFSPGSNIPLNSVYFRATGDYEMEVQPETQACGTTFRNAGGENYPKFLQSALGVATGAVAVTLAGPSSPTWVKAEWNSVVQVNTGWALPNATMVNNYNNLASTQRSDLQTFLTGKAVIGGSGNYPATPGGSGINEILSDGFPKIQLFTSTTFNKNAASPAFADVEVYNALGGTSGWQLTVSCPA